MAGRIDGRRDALMPCFLTFIGAFIAIAFLAFIGAFIAIAFLAFIGAFIAKNAV